MTTKRPWYPHYVLDYRADTSHLTLEEHGAYRTLIDEYWLAGGLPTDDRRLARILRLSLPEWLNIKPEIASLFLSNWKHKRIEKELKNSRDRRKHGQKGASKRWGNKVKLENAQQMPEDMPEDMPGECNFTLHNKRESLHLDLDPTEITKIRTSPKNCPSKTWTSLFDEFWQAWPNKVGKPAARKAFEKIAKCPEFDYEAILTGVERYKRQKPTDRSWLNPATFLNDERWNDEPADATPGMFVGRSNGTRGAIEAFLNGDTDPTGREKGTSEAVPLLPNEWRRE